MNPVSTKDAPERKPSGTETLTSEWYCTACELWLPTPAAAKHIAVLPHPVVRVR